MKTIFEYGEEQIRTSAPIIVAHGDNETVEVRPLSITQAAVWSEVAAVVKRTESVDLPLAQTAYESACKVDPPVPDDVAKAYDALCAVRNRAAAETLHMVAKYFELQATAMPQDFTHGQMIGCLRAMIMLSDPMGAANTFRQSLASKADGKTKSG